MTTPPDVPPEEIERRLFRIQNEMQQQGLDGLMIIQRVDLYYFSGTAQNGMLYVPAAGDPVLFVKRFTPRARRESPLEHLVEIGSVTEIPALLRDRLDRPPIKVGFELDVLPVRDFNFYCRLFKFPDPVDGSRAVLKVRQVKSEWELGQMDAAAALSARIFEYIRLSIRPGLSEIEFAGRVETFARKHGHGAMLRDRGFQERGYPWHILSGRSGGMVGPLEAPASGEGTSPAFPYGAGRKLLSANEPVMVDFGTVLNGYHMDETRMYAIGSIPDSARRATDAAMEIERRVMETAAPGVRVNALFDLSVTTADRLGYAREYLGPPGYKVGFIGHGIGTELVEPPFIARNRTDRLTPGMTFALEPKLVFQDEFAAGVESVYAVTESGCRRITRIPQEIFIC